jgi:hypothetical protein
MREQGLFDPARLVFIDETSANTKMVRLYGRCARGERLVDLEPHGHRKTITCVERCLAPTLKPNDIVMLDNLPAHKAAGVREAVEARARNASLSAQIFARPKPDRDVLQQVEGLSTQSRRADNSSPTPPSRLVRSQRHLLRSRELFGARKLCVKSIGICSRFLEVEKDR